MEKCNVKRVSSKCQECMACRGITEVDMLLLDERNECTYCVPVIVLNIPNSTVFKGFERTKVENRMIFNIIV